MTSSESRAQEGAREPAITIECTCSGMPNQYEGTVNGKPFYFRARWSGGWRLNVNDDPKGRGYDGQSVADGEEDQAGWWNHDEPEAFCLARLREYAAKEPR